jgi:hypothetical protein
MRTLDDNVPVGKVTVVKDFLPSPSQLVALHELEVILQPRIESAYCGEGVEITAMQIAEEILAEPRP